jgi:hypothetical protein
MYQIKLMEWSQLSKPWKITLIVLGTVLYILIPGSSLILIALVILKLNSVGPMALVKRLRRYSRRIFILPQKDR